MNTEKERIVLIRISIFNRRTASKIHKKKNISWIIKTKPSLSIHRAIDIHRLSVFFSLFFIKFLFVLLFVFVLWFDHNNNIQVARVYRASRLALESESLFLVFWGFLRRSRYVVDVSNSLDGTKWVIDAASRAVEERNYRLGHSSRNTQMLCWTRYMTKFVLTLIKSWWITLLTDSRSCWAIPRDLRFRVNFLSVIFI